MVLVVEGKKETSVMDRKTRMCARCAVLITKQREVYMLHFTEIALSLRLVTDFAR